MCKTTDSWWKIWNDKWEKLSPKNDQDSPKDEEVQRSQEALKTFHDKFERVYREVKWKKKKNRCLNFLWKIFFVLIYICFLWFFPCYVYKKNGIVKGEDIGYLILGWAVLTYLLGSIISKWLDIKKYQETWVRHSNHINAMEQEMVKFVFDLEIYNESGDKRKTFIAQILKVWENNQKEFSYNMYGKETYLLDMFDPFIEFAGSKRKKHKKKNKKENKKEKYSISEQKSESV